MEIEGLATKQYGIRRLHCMEIEGFAIFVWNLPSWNKKGLWVWKWKGYQLHYEHGMMGPFLFLSQSTNTGRSKKKVFSPLLPEKTRLVFESGETTYAFAVCPLQKPTRTSIQGVRVASWNSVSVWLPNKNCLWSAAWVKIVAWDGGCFCYLLHETKIHSSRLYTIGNCTVQKVCGGIWRSGKFRERDKVWEKKVECGVGMDKRLNAAKFKMEFKQDFLSTKSNCMGQLITIIFKTTFNKNASIWKKRR